jgi:hypothetical protein
MSNLSKEIYTNEAALLTNLFDAFEINEDNELDNEEFYNLVSFVFIVHEYNLHQNEVESEEHLISSMNSYHDKDAKEKTEELMVFFPNKPSISLDDFLNTLLINPIPYDWEKLTFFKELCIECYSKPKNFNYIAIKYNERFKTTIPLLKTIPIISPIPNIPLESYNNNPPIIINSQETAYDVIEGDVNLINYLKEDKNNCAFYFNSNFYLSNKEQIQKMMDFNEPDNEVVYKCNQASGSIAQNNVDTTKVFFRLRKIGLPLDYLPLGMLQTLIQLPNQYFIIEKTNDSLDSVVSNNVLYHEAEWVSASHCQEGQGGKIYIIKILNPQIQEQEQKGGKKVKRGKTKREKKEKKKVRKTRKSKKKI